jgi:hypothetical protein
MYPFEESGGIGERNAQAAKPSKKPPSGGFVQVGSDDYFIAPEAAVIAPEAASMADDAEVAADEAASIADDAAMLAEAAASVAGAIAAGGVVVVVVVDVSSFLLQAAKETAAASETMSNAVFIFLLDSGGSNSYRYLREPLCDEDPIVRRQGMRGISHA